MLPKNFEILKIYFASSTCVFVFVFVFFHIFHYISSDLMNMYWFRLLSLKLALMAKRILTLTTCNLTDKSVGVF